MAFTPFVDTDLPSMANFNQKFLDAIQQATDDAVDEAPKIATGSYVGTGTYGSSNPNMITADFPIKVLFLLGQKDRVGAPGTFFDTNYGNTLDMKYLTFSDALTTSYASNSYGASLYRSNTNQDPGSARAKKSEDGKTIYWYFVSAFGQFNESGYTYYYLALG